MPLFTRDGYEASHERQNKFAGWPGRVDGSRTWKDFDPAFEPKFVLTDAVHYFTIGSCFARNIEEYLIRHDKDVLSCRLQFPQNELSQWSRPNDLLVKYTPGSIYQELASAFGVVSSGEAADYLVEGRAGQYHDLNLPMWYPGVSFDRAVSRRAEVADLFRTIVEVDVLILTFGLVEHWWDRKLGIYINGVPPLRVLTKERDRFEFRVLGFAENFDLAKKSIELVRAHNPHVKIVLTTSPVPLTRTFTDRDVIVANTYSKSVLRVVCQELEALYPFVDYFPSYEMVAFSDQDTTWRDDLLHVADSKVGAIMNKFFGAYVVDGRANASERLLEAKRLRDAKKYHEAVALYRQIESSFAGDRRFTQELIETLFAAELYSEVLDACDKVDETMAVAPLVLTSKAKSLYHLSRHDEAIEAFEALERVRPSAVGICAGWIMAAAQKSGRADRALEAAKALSAIPLDSDFDNFPGWMARQAARLLRSEGLSALAERTAALFAECEKRRSHHG